MKENEIVNLTIDVVTDFYNQNVNLYFEYIDDDIIWFGPYEGLIFKGKNKMEEMYRQDHEKFRYKVANIQSNVVRLSSKAMEVILNYKISHYDEKVGVVEFSQRIQVSWVEKTIKKDDGSTENVPRIVAVNLVHIPRISENPNGKKAKSLVGTPPSMLISRADDERRMTLTGKDKSTLFLIPCTVVWVESIDGGLHSLVHVIDRDIECIHKISEIEKLYSDTFVRVHESYLVNPIFVTKVQRFSLQIINGPTLPIPERRYTKVKEQLKSYFE